MRRLGPGLLACLLLACADDLPPVGPRLAADIDVLSGDDQQGFPRQALADSLRVRVTDASGDPVPGATVTWEVSDAEGAVSPASSTTNTAGVASTAFTLGGAATSTITARVADGSAETTFTARANGFILDCEPSAVTEDKGDIRALNCAATSVGSFAAPVTLGAQSPANLSVSFASGVLDLSDTDGPVSTSAMLEIAFGAASGVYPVVLRAQHGASMATDTVVVTVR